MGFMRPKTPKGPSPGDLQRAQDAAAERERKRLEQESAAKKAEQEQKALADMQAQESKRRAFAGQLTQTTEDENQRRKFLKGA